MSIGTVVVALAAACSSAPPTAPTARVERGTVAAKVTATGALTAVTSQNLGFPKGAQLKEVNVKVGDKVTAGQVLAKLDTFAFDQALAQQRAALNQQQAQLDKIVNGTAVGGARATLDQAKRILSATQSNVDAQKKANSDATRRARVQLDFDQEQLDKARQKLDFDGCSQDGLDDEPSSGRRRSSDSRASTGSGSDLTSDAGGAATSTCGADRQAVTTAERQVLASRTAHTEAKNKENVDEAAGKVSVENARQSVVTAQNQVNSTGTDRPSEIAAQTAVVNSAKAAVALAQRDVDNSVLRAPVPGTVSAINGAVGEFVGSASSGTTALAPGTGAPIPSVGAAATSDQSGNSGAGLSATRPGGNAFLVLNDVNTFQVVVPFEESDAAKVSANQRVDVTFDAVPDLTRHGTVLSVAPAGTSISGVTNYYATIVLTDTDPRLRTGQSAQAGVLVNALDNVLTVPNTAVIRKDGKTLVNTPGPDGQPVLVPFQAGAVGDDTTQVLSGLRDGQPVLTPQAKAPGS
ncbi:efflux RND transporter periplasmic adaptor subunit [Pseudonocardia acaciae]|uniref:efflux RND transporter periplasmic adaptor subunit n=1 Tax=Pseudonocardia acaciae TaxID=551276 RepID=UPI000B0A61D1|nr:HlyD family efflux transporter periplasmic adaptor subunit [Pseudonocardia acaciae]